MKKVSGSEGYGSRKVNRGTGYYVDGNTVRRVEEVPQRKKKQVSTAAQKNRARNMQMSKGYVMFLAVMCVAVLFACVHFLKLKSELTEQKSQLTAEELKYSQLKAENDAYYSETISSVDLDAIRKKAIEELGMKFPTEDQIKYYTPGGSSYVRQYQDVPEK